MITYCGWCAGCCEHEKDPYQLCSKRYCINYRNPNISRLEKLQKILSNGVEYIYQAALQRFNNKCDDEHRADDLKKTSENFDYVECIVCSNDLSICNCYDTNQNSNGYGWYVYTETDKMEIDKHSHFEDFSNSICQKVANTVCKIDNRMSSHNNDFY